MVSPVLEPDAKKRALQSLVGEQVTPSLLNLLKVLADRQRLQAFDAVMERFLELYREQQGITLAQVRSAQALSDDQQAALSKKVQAMAGTDKVDIDLSVDPSLIGGFVVSLGSQVIDASLAGQVRRSDWHCQGELTLFLPSPLHPPPLRWTTRHGFHPSRRDRASSNSKLRITTSPSRSAMSAPFSRWVTASPATACSRPW